MRNAFSERTIKNFITRNEKKNKREESGSFLNRLKAIEQTFFFPFAFYQYGFPVGIIVLKLYVLHFT